MYQIYTGRNHKLTVLVCSHEAPGVTLIRHRLWPSTLRRTTVAFEFSLMEWTETMYLECHVSCRSLCQALKLIGQQSPQLVSWKGVCNVSIEEAENCLFCHSSMVNAFGRSSLSRRPGQKGSAICEQKLWCQYFMQDSKINLAAAKP